MSPMATGRRRTPGVGLFLAAVLVGCGPDVDSRSNPVEPPPAGPPPGPARIAAKASPSIEECIERNIHDARYDAMGPRDARRKLRRLEVKADCESTTAAR